VGGVGVVVGVEEEEEEEEEEVSYYTVRELVQCSSVVA
jgi:hypothetical protein